MRLLFIRHGDPDYENDTVTEKGKREVELLAQRAESLELGHCFVSPLGRAQDTAAPSLARTGKNAETLDWLEEFPAKIDLNKVPHLIKAYHGGHHTGSSLHWDKSSSISSYVRSQHSERE